MNGQMGEWVGGWMMDRWVSGWMLWEIGRWSAENIWVGRWVGGRVDDGWMDGWKVQIWKMMAK